MEKRKQQSTWAGPSRQQSSASPHVKKELPQNCRALARCADLFPTATATATAVWLGQSRSRQRPSPVRAILAPKTSPRRCRTRVRSRSR